MLEVLYRALLDASALRPPISPDVREVRAEAIQLQPQTNMKDQPRPQIKIVDPPRPQTNIEDQLRPQLKIVDALGDMVAVTVLFIAAIVFLWFAGEIYWWLTDVFWAPKPWRD